MVWSAGAGTTLQKKTKNIWIPFPAYPIPLWWDAQMQAHPWPVAMSRDRGGWGGSTGPGETQMRSAWLFNDPWTGQWVIALDYQVQPCNPIYQVLSSPPLATCMRVCLCACLCLRMRIRTSMSTYTRMHFMITLPIHIQIYTGRVMSLTYCLAAAIIYYHQYVCPFWKDGININSSVRLDYGSSVHCVRRIEQWFGLFGRYTLYSSQEEVRKEGRRG